jgi:lysophospholipase L1-like esterase
MPMTCNLAALILGLLILLPAAAYGDSGDRMLRQQIRPAEPPGLSVVIGHGFFEVGWKQVSVPDTEVSFKPPEARDGKMTAKIPGNYAAYFDSWEPWPAEGKKDPANFISLSPAKDENGILMLGGLYRAIPEDTVVVKNSDGTRTFKSGEDYQYNANWGQISNLNGKLGAPGSGELQVTYRYYLQRIDLVEMDGAGKISVKQGTSAMVCPAIPEADAGHKALAGIYIAPWKQAVEYAVTEGNIFPVNPAPPVEPVNAKALERSRQKLAGGTELKIAFLGDSISLGAESGAWWENLWTEKNLGFPSRVVVALRRKFPKATVTPIAAFQGAITTQGGLELFEKNVLPQKPDLVIIELGTNDASGPVNGAAKNPPEKYKQDMLAFIQKSKAAGAEVLLVSPMAVNPFLMSHAAERIPRYNKALRELSESENVGFADTYTKWLNQGTHGVAPYSQLHNWINHPGPNGHKLYADLILRFFDGA